MIVRPRSIPGEDSQGVKVVVASVAPGGRITLSIDEQTVGSGPLHRGSGPPFLARAGLRVTEPSEQRLGMRSAVVGSDSHLARFLVSNPESRPAWITGAGNLGMNPGVVARRKDRRFGFPGAISLAMAAGPLARGRLVPADATPPDGAFTISGPLLVASGKPVPPDPPAYADPRHLLLFAYVTVESHGPVDFGLDALLQDTALYRRAVAGEVVTLPLEMRLPKTLRVETEFESVTLDSEKVISALTKKGYSRRRGTPERGTFDLGRTEVSLRFFEGIYPHHVLIRLPDSQLRSLLISGKSNRSGVTIPELSAQLASQGVEDAVLLDNGGDVGLFDVANSEFVISPAEFDRQHLWPLTACLIWSH